MGAYTRKQTDEVVSLHAKPYRSTEQVQSVMFVVSATVLWCEQSDDVDAMPSCTRQQ